MTWTRQQRAKSRLAWLKHQRYWANLTPYEKAMWAIWRFKR